MKIFFIFVFLNLSVFYSYSQGTEFVVEYKLKNKPKITLRIDSLEIHNFKFGVNFLYKGKIKKQTGLLKVNDSISVNVIFFKMKINGEKEYFNSVNFYRKNKSGEWKEVSDIYFYKLTPGSYTNGWGGVGSRGTKNSFWYKIYCKFE